MHGETGVFPPGQVLLCGRYEERMDRVVGWLNQVGERLRAKKGSSRLVYSGAKIEIAAG